ncbi:unnamed protein product, partial [Cyprideis torosa]
MLKVLRNHKRAAYNVPHEEYEDLTIYPHGINPKYCPSDLLKAAQHDANHAVDLGKKYGYRNAQVTVIAPTGTIGLVMDCDTTGIEPDYALVKFKKLAGGGYFKIINQSIPPALTGLMSGDLTKAEDAYTHPQPHACFIQSVDDDLVNENGIMDLWVREARLFKYGSGTGTNFSGMRGADEPLSGGGKSSGLMSFLKIGDRSAGAIKSGGTTRRAAKMVTLDIDHPDIEEYINWKSHEEQKVAAIVTEYDTDWNSEAYATVSGQNSNNSVRVTNEFMQAVVDDADWNLYWRTEIKNSKKSGKKPAPCKTLKARDLWEQIGYAAWSSADPGLQYDTTINEWHTCLNDGRINASNPCSEYMFLDDTACNLASMNLVKFYSDDKQQFNIKAFRHATKLLTIVLEISVMMAQYPSKSVAQNSYDYRTLGLGYANLGSLLMRQGIPYD